MPTAFTVGCTSVSKAAVSCHHRCACRRWAQTVAANAVQEPTSSLMSYFLFPWHCHAPLGDLLQVWLFSFLKHDESRPSLVIRAWLTSELSFQNDGIAPTISENSHSPAGSCRRPAERRRSNRPSLPPGPPKASLQSYGAELDWHLSENSVKSWNAQLRRRRVNVHTEHGAVSHPPRSLMVTVVTLAADREWTFLSRKQETRWVVITFREKSR